MEKTYSLTDLIGAIISSLIIGGLIMVGGMAIIYKSWRPEVVQWRKLIESPDVEVPEIITWEGGMYECISVHKREAK